jgi:membrane associated rhomboid family serine protease
MQQRDPLVFSPSVILYPILFVLGMWIVFWAEIRFHLDLNHWGVLPRSIEGLRGVLFSPFIHSNLEHLFSNTMPMLVLSTALFYFYQKDRWRILLLGVLLTGVLTWTIARPAYHIGMSGVIYMLTAFLFFKGIFSKQYQLTALAFVVVFLYGSLVWYAFAGGDPRISWEGHLSGFVVGFGLSLLFKQNPIENKMYQWEDPDFNPEDDPFLRQFDDFGNFIDPIPDVEIEIEALAENQTEQMTSSENFGTKKIRYIYKYKPNDPASRE